MSHQLKIAAYVVLLGCGVWFGVAFFKNFSAATATPREASESTNQSALPATNQTATAETNSSESATNASGGTNAATNVAVSAKVQPPPKRVEPPSRGRSASAMMAYGAGLVISAICFGLLI